MVNVDHFHEAYKFLTPIRTDKITSIQIGCEPASNALNILAEVPEGSSVSSRYTVVNPMDGSHEIIVKRCNFHGHPALGGAPYIFPRLLRQIFPPVLKASCRHGGPIVPFRVIIEFRRHLRGPLSKRKDIGF